MAAFGIATLITKAELEIDAESLSAQVRSE